MCVRAGALKLIDVTTKFVLVLKMLYPKSVSYYQKTRAIVTIAVFFFFKLKNHHQRSHHLTLLVNELFISDTSIRFVLL